MLQISENCRDSLETNTLQTKLTNMSQNTPEISSSNGHVINPKDALKRSLGLSYQNQTGQPEEQTTSRQESSPVILKFGQHTRSRGRHELSRGQKSSGRELDETKQYSFDAKGHEHEQIITHSNPSNTQTRTVSHKVSYLATREREGEGHETTHQTQQDGKTDRMEGEKELTLRSSSQPKDEGADQHARDNSYLIPLQKDSEHYQRRSNMDSMLGKPYGSNLSHQRKNQELEIRLNQLESQL